MVKSGEGVERPNEKSARDVNGDARCRALAISTAMRSSKRDFVQTRC